VARLEDARWVTLNVGVERRIVRNATPPPAAQIAAQITWLSGTPGRRPRPVRRCRGREYGREATRGAGDAGDRVVEGGTDTEVVVVDRGEHRRGQRRNRDREPEPEHERSRSTDST